MSPDEVSNGKLVGYSLTFIKWSLTGVLDLNEAFRHSIFLEVTGYKLYFLAMRAQGQRRTSSNIYSILSQVLIWVLIYFWVRN